MQTSFPKETSELLLCGARLWLDVERALADDGRVSTPEAVKIAWQRMEDFITACRGASRIPAELVKVDREELDALYHPVMAELGWEPGDSRRAMLDMIYRTIRDIISRYRAFKNIVNPPRAEVVSEIEGVDPP